jgi:uncharacterized protein YfdQ (DUF2303 family)
MDDSLTYKKDQNIKISNLLKKNSEKMKQREIDKQLENVQIDNFVSNPNQAEEPDNQMYEDTVTVDSNKDEDLSLSKVDRELQSNDRFIRENMASSKF